MTDSVIICDDSGCEAPAIILIGGVGYCTQHALRQIRKTPQRACPKPTRSPKRKRPLSDPSDQRDHPTS